MTLWINIVFAWIAMTLSFLLTVIWALRLINKKKKIPALQRINRALRKHHKTIGLLLIATSLVHGLFSSDALLSLNWGTANWIIGFLLGISWMLRKKLNLKKWWMYIHRVLTVAFVGILFIHILNVGGFIFDDLIVGKFTMPSAAVAQVALAADNSSEEAASSPTILATQEPLSSSMAVTAQTAEASATSVQTSAYEPTTAATYVDGTYEGTGVGFQPGLVVEVVIENDMIISVTIISHNEQNKKYWGVPIEAIPAKIIESQSTIVDTVSGATCTSIGIIEAVNDALNQALR
jgi:uncharacterized protein with FMN-binding domain